MTGQRPAGHTTRATQSQIAEALGVTTNQVYMWLRRQDRNGFPAQCGERRWGRRVLPVWEINEVIDWWVNYEPSRGGAPAGNHNALKHGGFVGDRDQRERRRLRKQEQRAARRATGAADPHAA